MSCSAAERSVRWLPSGSAGGGSFFEELIERPDFPSTKAAELHAHAVRLLPPNRAIEQRLVAKRGKEDLDLHLRPVGQGSIREEVHPAETDVARDALEASAFVDDHHVEAAIVSLVDASPGVQSGSLSAARQGGPFILRTP